MVVSIKSIRFSEEDGNRFINVIKSAKSSLTSTQISQPYIYNYEKNAIVISYDGNYKPFLGFTFGFNPKVNRKYLESCSCLDQIGNVFKEYSNSQGFGIPGGRIFITQLFLIHEFDKISFLTWEDHPDIVMEIKKLF